MNNNADAWYNLKFGEELYIEDQHAETKITRVPGGWTWTTMIWDYETDKPLSVSSHHIPFDNEFQEGGRSERLRG